jgi:Pretoxin HINT domain
MIGLIVCSAVLAANPPADATPPPATYLEARSRAGRTPDDQVRLALWCEAHGLAAERLHHLTLAVLADPKNATARGLMGLVAYQDRWLRPESIADRLKAEPSLAEYEARRLETPETADGQSALGVWADEHGLRDQARAHLAFATRIDPSRADAWKRLGYSKHDGRWVSQAQIVAEKAEIEAQKRADQKWKPLLEKYRLMLATPSRRDEGEAGLAGVTDPRAVPSIGRVFATTGPQEPRAVRLLGQIDAPSSTRALAYLAVFARSAEARRAATETLRNRDPREYADLLIALLQDPIRFEVKHVNGPGSPGELLVEGKRVNVRRLYTPPPVFRAGDRLGFDALGRAVVVRPVEPAVASMQPGGLVDAGTTPVSSMTPAEARQAFSIMQESLASNPLRPTTRFTFQFADRATISLGQMVAEAQKSSVATERKLREDVRMLEDHNVDVRLANDRVSSVLNDATRQSLPAERGAWTTWWVDQIGYASSSSEWTSRASVVEDVSIAYQPPDVPEGAARQILGYGRRSCFGAGTPVRTIAGPRAIEALQVGDRVLTQDTTTGRLGYHPILAVHRNPPSPTFRIKLEGESIVTSHFHRFWVAGQGWVMARDLKPGDPIRTLGGVAPVESIEVDVVQLVYNLDVADDADFFAGHATALVHDNTLPDPRLTPFDAPKVAKE